MEEIKLHFTDQIEKKELPLEIKDWLGDKAVSTSFKTFDLAYIFCSDDEILEMNKQFLNHDYYTDILTFDLSETKEHLEAECYISLERVSENAKNLKKGYDKELFRVMAHGLLHLLGYDDKTKEQVKQMRSQENEMLTKLRSTWNVNF